MRKLMRLFVLAALLFSSSSALASNYRLDFGGQTSTGAFGGYFILDFSVPDGEPDDPDRGSYSNIVVSLSVEINGISYAAADPAAPIFGFVTNNSGLVGDYFGVGGGVLDANGDQGFIAVQFQNLDGTVFNSDQLPTDFEFTDFDPFNILNSNSTGAVVDTFIGVGLPEFYALDFATLTAVPLPAGVWLLMSAIGAVFGFRARSSR